MTIGIVCTVVIGLIALWLAFSNRLHEMAGRRLAGALYAEMVRRDAIALALQELHNAVSQANHEQSARYLAAEIKLAGEPGDEIMRRAIAAEAAPR